MRLAKPLLIAAVLVVASAAVASAKTVQTFSFETPNLQSVYGDSYEYNPSEAGVTFNGAAGASGNGGSGLSSNGSAFVFPTTSFGDQVAFIQNASGVDGAVVLSLSGLTAGTTYDASFYTASRSGYGFDPLSIAYDATTIGTMASGGSTAFAKTSLSFVATGSTGTLAFTGVGPTSGDIDTALDNVTISSVSAAPEPSTWFLMTAGVAILGGALRSARRRSGAIALA